MDIAEIRRHISEGADFSLRLLGDAEHMEYTRHEAYSIIRPHNGEEGGSSIFELNLHNRILYDGYTILHPEKHYHLCEKGKLLCYTGYYDQVPAAIAGIMDNNGISSLESVATLADYRQKGLARAVCSAAIEGAFKSGSKIITTRAVPKIRNLCRSLGFKSY